MVCAACTLFSSYWQCPPLFLTRRAHSIFTCPLPTLHQPLQPTLHQTTAQVTCPAYLTSHNKHHDAAAAATATATSAARQLGWLLSWPHERVHVAFGLWHRHWVRAETLRPPGGCSALEVASHCRRSAVLPLCCCLRSTHATTCCCCCCCQSREEEDSPLFFKRTPGGQQQDSASRCVPRSGRGQVSISCLAARLASSPLANIRPAPLAIMVAVVMCQQVQ